MGRELVAVLGASPSYSQIHLLLRRPQPELLSGPALTQHVVDFDALPALPVVQDAYIALGTTIKQAGSQAAFRRVDFDYVLAVARGALAAGATRLGVVSAVGADARSSVFYNRVKGEMQEALSELCTSTATSSREKYASVVIVQPSLLLGDRSALGQPRRAGEVWAERLLVPLAGVIPKGFRPVRARAVAQALVHAVLHPGPGVSILPSRALHDVSE